MGSFIAFQWDFPNTLDVRDLSGVVWGFLGGGSSTIFALFGGKVKTSLWFPFGKRVLTERF